MAVYLFSTYNYLQSDLLNENQAKLNFHYNENINYIFAIKSYENVDQIWIIKLSCDHTDTQKENGQID